jgi:hypothetical protein
MTNFISEPLDKLADSVSENTEELKKDISSA